MRDGNIDLLCSVIFRTAVVTSTTIVKSMILLIVFNVALNDLSDICEQKKPQKTNKTNKNENQNKTKTEWYFHRI